MKVQPRGRGKILLWLASVLHLRTSSGFRRMTLQVCSGANQIGKQCSGLDSVLACTQASCTYLGAALMTVELRPVGALEEPENIPLIP